MAARQRPVAATIDAYLARLEGEQRAALQKLRKTIQSIVPRATECISYGVPAFRHDGRVLVGFGAGANHCTFFPMSGTTVAAHQALLASYETSKGAIRFQPERPLPAALVRKLVKARLLEIAEHERAATSAPMRRKPGKPER